MCIIMWKIRTKFRIGSVIGICISLLVRSISAKFHCNDCSFL